MKLIPALRLDDDLRRPGVVTVVGGGGKTTLVFRLAREFLARAERVVTATTTRVARHQMEQAPVVLRIAAGAPLPATAVARALDEHRHVLLVGDETLFGGKQRGVEPAIIDALAAQADALGIAAILVEGDGSRTLPAKAPGDHEPVVAASTTLLLPVLGMEAVGGWIDEAHVHRPERMRAVLGLDDAPARLTPALAARLLTHSLGGAKALPPGARLVALLNKAESIPALAAARMTAALLAEAGYPALIAAAGLEEREPVIERWGPFAAIVLAAGEGRRFAGPKQAAIVGGETLAQRAARLALESGAAEVIVVTGAHAAATRSALAALGAQAGGRLRLVHNEAWSSGQASSLRAGLAALAPSTEALLCLPVDQPLLDPTLLRRLVTAWQRGAALAAPLAEGEVRGAPALFDRDFFAQLAAVEGDRGGRDLLRSHSAQVAAIPVAAAALADIDTRADLDALTNGPG